MHSLLSDRRKSEDESGWWLDKRETNVIHTPPHKLTFTLSIYPCEVDLPFRVLVTRQALAVIAADRVDAHCIFTRDFKFFALIHICRFGIEELREGWKDWIE